MRGLAGWLAGLKGSWRLDWMNDGCRSDDCEERSLEHSAQWRGRGVWLLWVGLLHGCSWGCCWMWLQVVVMPRSALMLD